MAVTGDTGNGATLTLALFDGTTAITTALDVISITPAAITVGKIDASTLGTSGHREYFPDDLSDSGENTATFKYIAEGTKPTLPSAAGTCTITMPLKAPSTTAGTITGTGFITSFTPPSLENGALQVGTISWAWDGDTGPTITAAT
jgi:hypothetical protein